VVVLPLLAAAAGCVTLSRWFPAELTLTWLGAGGWSISDGTHLVLVDPSFARPEDPLHAAASDPRTVEAHLPAHVDVILIGHAHVDHALDAPAIARRTGALLVGSPEVIAAARAAGVPEPQLKEVRGGERFEVAGGSVRVIPSLPPLTGAENGAQVGTVAYLVKLKGTEVLVFDTDTFSERELEGLRPHAAIIATGLRGRPPGSTCKLMRALGAPRAVLPTHFDDWLTPAQTPRSYEGRADLLRFVEEVHSCAPDTRVVEPRVFEPVVLRN
jgi:L-ascorbate metabolism protein UlaG (beta-lactamase superfamily)